MSLGLKPLLLPRLVEERRKLNDDVEDQLPPPPPPQAQAQPLQHPQSPYYAHDSSSSDLASPSPVASTFSRSNHLRLSGSSSSLELITPPGTESPTSPTQSLHVARPSKSQLPDVAEEPLERDDEEAYRDHVEEDTRRGPLATPPRRNEREFSFHDYCLCDFPCSHNADAAQTRTSTNPYMLSDPDYDLGFLSDGDFNTSPRSKKRRHGSDSGFSNWSTRLGSRLPSLPRWRSSSISRRHDLTFFPASDPSLAEPRPSLSLAASSRSSSLSRPAHASDHAQDSVPATPALSFYESSESVAIPSPLDGLHTLPATLGRRVERDRIHATTPLLPPLLTDAIASHTQPPSLQASPLQSPTMISQTLGPADPPAAVAYPTPPLSGKPSMTSLRRGTMSSTFSDAPSPVPCLFDHSDSWSDRLGHANFTIEPRPYACETADLATLQSFRADWNLARTNYAKHLVRTGEHYGSTSKTFALTEAKWAETELEWQQNEEQLVDRLGQQWKDHPSVVSQLRRTAEETLSPSVPHMLSDDGKFPELGDVEIIGPMLREAAMVRDPTVEDRRNSASVWLKNLAGKVGLRK
ncbi:uncharacterized protein C8A04DRAFT_36021 [Dichotomopilus funicola]|uniref:Only prolin and serin are matching in the corresponding protein n=1 Tax=Dichotomopilus funicola TaxID=1934379 RepID=A0AAN6ZNK3_9PEZI|nr:hypothetical protein C8A04DRAFT_36021 [Dichotomopilus funicola]